MWYIGWSTCCTFAVHWQMKPSYLFSLRAFGHSSKAWVSLSLNIVFECFWYILMILKSYPVIWSSQLLDRWRTEGCLPFSDGHHIFCSRTLNWQCGWILLCHIPFCFDLIREAVRWQTHAQNFNDLLYHPCTLHSIFAEHYLPHDYIYIYYKFANKCGHIIMNHHQQSIKVIASFLGATRYPLINVYITMEHHHFSWENSLFLWFYGHFQ